jgi:hypothetical protein
MILCFTPCITIGDPVIERGRVGIPLTGLNLSHFYPCLKPEHGFQTYVACITHLINIGNKQKKSEIPQKVTDILNFRLTQKLHVWWLEVY